MTPDQMMILLTASGAIIGAGGIWFWRKGDDVTDNIRKGLIEASADCAVAGWTVCSGMAKNLASGDIKGLLSEVKRGAEIARDPIKRLAHTGDMTMANINSLLKDPKFGPQIRKAVKDQDILIDSKDSTTSSPV